MTINNRKSHSCANFAHILFTTIENMLVFMNNKLRLYIDIPVLLTSDKHGAKHFLHVLYLSNKLSILKNYD